MSTTPATLRSARRTFRRILHPDMTPMVGLGFLLVTFFMLAADFQKPTIMQLSMPVSAKRDPEESYCPGPSSDGLTLILGKNGMIHYYRGMFYFSEITELQTLTGGSAELRSMLLDERKINPKMVVLIKPSDDAKYRDLVDVLDEMNITDMKKYAVVDMHKEDYELLKQHGL